MGAERDRPHYCWPEWQSKVQGRLGIKCDLRHSSGARWLWRTAPFNALLLRVHPGGGLTFEGNASVGYSTITVDGGVGFNAPSGLVTFQGNSMAVNAVFHTKGGRRGAYSPYLCCLEEAGKGGQVRFEGNSTANISTFENEGVAEFRGGTGGLSVFADNATASYGTFHNHGATYNKGGGGATHFLNNSTAGNATITNHADATFVYSSMSGQTVFYIRRTPAPQRLKMKTVSILSTPQQDPIPQQLERRERHHRKSRNPNLGGGSAGLTEFYDTGHSRENATLNLYEGYYDLDAPDFHNQSTAAAPISIS